MSIMRLEDIERDEGNFFAALDWARRQPGDLWMRLCVVMYDLWMLDGRVSEGRALYEGCLSAGIEDLELRLNVLELAGAFAGRQCDYERAEELFDEAFALTNPTDDTRRHCGLLLQRGLLDWARGDGATAVRLCEESLALLRAHRLDADTAVLRIVLAWARYVAGDVAGGDEAGLQALAIAANEGDLSGVVGARHVLHYGAFLAGNVPAQREHITAAFAAVEQGGKIVRSDLIGSAGVLAAVEGRSQAALRLFGGMEAFSRRHGSRTPDHLIVTMAEPYFRVFEAVGPDETQRLIAEGARMSWGELAAIAVQDPLDDAAAANPLTRREQEIAKLVGDGLGNVEIARLLVISRRTVESHLEHIRQKLGFTSRHALMAWILKSSPGGG